MAGSGPDRHRGCRGLFHRLAEPSGAFEVHVTIGRDRSSFLRLEQDEVRWPTKMGLVCKGAIEVSSGLIGLEVS